jgi:hypothetical protein
MIEYKVGMLVTNPKAPQWGLGKILVIEPDKLTVYFRDVRENKAGDAQKKINPAYVSLKVSSRQSDPWLDNIPRLKDGKLSLPRLRWTLDQAIESFRREFPLGFKDPEYKGEERNYKWSAHKHFVETLGGGIGEQLLADGEIPELTKRALSIVGSVNLLFPQEQMALRDALKNSDASKSFFSTLFEALAPPRPERRSFEIYIDAITSLPAEKGRARVATWPVLTILPFLAKPDSFMFLKPEVTQCAADTRAFDLLYDSKLNWNTYERLLTMSDLLMNHLRALGARDWIDVQSFIWVTAEGSVR